MPRELPKAPEAEASLLGNMLLYPSSVRTAMEEGLSEDDFFVEANAKIYRACSELYNRGDVVDLTTVTTKLKDLGLLDSCGGIQYLTDLADSAVTSANTLSYIRSVHDKAIMRRMIEAAEKVAENGMTTAEGINEYLDESEKLILNVSRDRRTTEFKTSPELVGNVLATIRQMSENKSDVTGLATGFRDLDRMTHGLQRGDLIVVAARPSMGKTAVALNLALNVARRQREGAVAIFSLEMGAEQLEMRLLSATSGIEGDKLRTGYLQNEEWNRLNEAAGVLRNSSIYIDDTSGIRMPEIFSKCRRLSAEKTLNLIMIDYIQLIQGSGRSGENRQQEISEISRNLKALAREMNVPVIALSQLNRSVEQRENKHPMLSDLRESGAIEQDADIVMMLYRAAYYQDPATVQRTEDGNEVLEINIAKHRNGAIGRVELMFNGATNALYNISKKD